jgi:hypothetical protein
MHITYSDRTSKIPVDRLSTLFLISVDCGELTIPFVFDTGGSMTVVNKTTADTLYGIPCAETVTVGGNACARFIADTIIIPMLKIGEVIIHDLKAIIVDDDILDFGVDENSTPFCFNGFLGWDVIQHFAWHYDAPNSCFHMNKPVVAQGTATMALWDNMPLIYALHNGKKMLFGFDTGNTETVLGEKLYETMTNAKEGWDTFAGIDGVLETEVHIAEEFEIQIGQHTVRLQKISIVNRQVFPSKNKDICGLLAADIIQGKSWTLDYFNRSFEISER